MLNNCPDCGSTNDLWFSRRKNEIYVECSACLLQGDPVPSKSTDYQLKAIAAWNNGEKKRVYPKPRRNIYGHSYGTHRL